MRTYDEPEEPVRTDTEITLGVRSILGIFFGLALICGVFFGFGYSVGRGGATKSAVVKLTRTQTSTQTQAQTPATPLQTVVEPSGTSANPENTATTLQPAAAPASSKPSAATSAPPAPAVAAVQPAAAAGTPAAQARPAAYNPASTPKAVPAAYTAPKPVAHPQYIMVQIAAVARRQDADVLVAALRRIGYTPVIRTDSGDHLLHVQVGPFGSRSAAQGMRAKLLSAGYNAILKPE